MWSGSYFLSYIIIRYHHQINSLFGQAVPLDIATFLIDSSHNNEGKTARDRRVVTTDMTDSILLFGVNSIYYRV